MSLAIEESTYRTWLLFGGSRTEASLRFLSKDIIENRKLIYELRRSQKKLEERVWHVLSPEWELEKHSQEENLERIRKDLDSFSESLDEFLSR